MKRFGRIQIQCHDFEYAAEWMAVDRQDNNLYCHQLSPSGFASALSSVSVPGYRLSSSPVPDDVELSRLAIDLVESSQQ